ncbi:hypothetical protein [Cupriavidus metallidurans]|uniref:hypothetical protein n=1 Tax=Cupriavidus metallidurans TaxID=119219 RepID=UPI001CB8DFF2|nr:hypothetical protein [Cupriavidus metallidurans]
MKIYLDYNLFAYLHEGTKPDLHAKVSALFDRHEFPYSPAHMGEIATTLAKPSESAPLDRLASAFCKIDDVSLISRNTQLSPTTLGPMVVKEEQPLECFLRVMRHCRKDPDVEKNEWQMQAGAKEIDLYRDLTTQASNVPREFLDDPEHREKLQLKLLLRSDLPLICRAHGVEDISWPTISYHFPVLQRAIELTMGFVEESSYRPEGDRQSRSRKHDVAHSIYASGCEQFVTDDRHMYHKVRATYRYLSIPTEVLMLDDFVARNCSPRTESD